MLLLPRRDHASDVGEVKRSERIGGLLKFYYREAAQAAQVRISGDSWCKSSKS
ncbi:MAG: hypothetical protein V2A73_14900 [Pseudomonadota bacterium]